MASPTIAFGNDHAGVELKAILIEEVKRQGIAVLDLGTNTHDSVDYPDYADAVAAAMADGRAQRGVLICGTGLGICMEANRHEWIRAAVVHDVTTARLAREHNDANVLCMGARVIGPETAIDSLRTFLATDFSHGERHERRIAKMSVAKMSKKKGL